MVGDGAAQIKENLTNWLPVPVPSEFYQHLFLHVLMTLKSVTYILISLKIKNSFLLEITCKIDIFVSFAIQMIFLMFRSFWLLK